MPPAARESTPSELVDSVRLLRVRARVHGEPVAGARVEARSEARHGEVVLQAHPVALEVDEVVTRVHPADTTDENVTARGLDPLEERALERHRRLDDTRGAHRARGRGREPDLVDLAHLRRKVFAAAVH